MWKRRCAYSCDALAGQGSSLRLRDQATFGMRSQEVDVVCTGLHGVCVPGPRYSVYAFEPTRACVGELTANEQHHSVESSVRIRRGSGSGREYHAFDMLNE